MDVAEEPLGLGGGSWGRPGADGAGFSETLPREWQFCEGMELFAGGQRKRYLRPPPPPGSGQGPFSPEGSRCSGQAALSVCKLVGAVSQPPRGKSPSAGTSMSAVGSN